jgi:hypothetical protein
MGEGDALPFFDRQNEQFRCSPILHSRSRAPHCCTSCLWMTAQSRPQRERGPRRDPPFSSRRFKWELWNAGDQGEGGLRDFRKTTINILDPAAMSRLHLEARSFRKRRSQVRAVVARGSPRPSDARAPLRDPSLASGPAAAAAVLSGSWSRCCGRDADCRRAAQSGRP